MSSLSSSSSKKKSSPKTLSMPGLVFNESQFNKEAKKEASERTTSRLKKRKSIPLNSRVAKKNSNSSSDTVSSQTKKTATPPTSLLWLGVTTSLVIVIAVLGWSFKVQLGFLNWQNADEKTLLDKTADNWKQAFTVVASETDLQKQIDKLDVEDALHDVIASSTTSQETFLSTSTTSSTN